MYRRCRKKARGETKKALTAHSAMVADRASLTDLFLSVRHNRSCAERALAWWLDKVLKSDAMQKTVAEGRQLN